VTGGGTPPITTTPSLALTNTGQSHRRWREGTALPHIARAQLPVGTTFRFTLNESAEVRFGFKQLLPGRSVGGRCVAATRSRRNRPNCWRKVIRGKLYFRMGAGAHTLRFQGRVSRHKRLPVGRYVLVITAINATGQKATARLRFTIAG